MEISDILKTLKDEIEAGKDPLGALKQILSQPGLDVQWFEGLSFLEIARLFQQARDLAGTLDDETKRQLMQAVEEISNEIGESEHLPKSLIKAFSSLKKT